MRETPGNYHAYLLRIWRAEGDGWQASLQDAKTSQLMGFAGLEELFAFLIDHVESPPLEDPPSGLVPLS